ncbi:MAG: PQQ-dependent dehydrogenase, methanol/ethanol family [Candidatus Eremiobacteraeota bacterium]|nr:PQQ-dependent dehydrogenase, methanol/ethanol family [Candidatus Eremiobacteraeota bacterium]
MKFCINPLELNHTMRLCSVFAAFTVLLGQPLTAQVPDPSGAPPARSGMGSAPLPDETRVPEPAMVATANADSPGHPLNNAHAGFAPNDPPGEWHSQARDYANTRYSPLEQITTANVAKLRIAWSFSDGTPNGHEAAPLVVGDTMYIVTPFPNLAYALDLSKAGAPIKWSYDPKSTPIAIGKACCDTVNRGAAYVDGKLIYNLLDDHTVAIDAKTGKEVWRTKMGNVTEGGTMTMAPLIVGDKVYVGNSGGELGVWGWLAALDIKTGKELWRAHSSGTDKEVMIGTDFKPFYSWMQGKDLGRTSWPAGMWKTGAGAVWGWVSYDSETNLIYYGTSNPGPRVPSQRPGYNLWSSAMFARDASTGMAKWAYQFTPHDQWDYDGVNENVLLDLTFDGKPRKVLVHFDRNAFAYTIDRTSGEVLSAAPFAYQNWSHGINLETGMPMVVAEMQPKPNVKLSNVCPPDIGGKDWQPSAFSPRTGLIYAGIFNICMDVTDHPQSYIPGTPYDGMEMTRHAGPGGNWGEFMAWDAVAGKKAWSIKEQFMIMSGTLATAGDVVFYGTVDGWFRAVDARSGKVLWSQKLSSGIIGQPMTYLGPDQRQYIAVYSGVGGAAMVSSAQPGFPPRGGVLYVFSIDGDSPHSAAGMLTTESPVSAVRSDRGMGGKP